MTDQPTPGSGRTSGTSDAPGTGAADLPASGGVGHARVLRCRTVATAQLRQRHHIRDLEPIGSGAGRPADDTLLGEDEEPHPSEMLLAALGACLALGIQANAAARGIPLRALEVHGTGEVDLSARWGTGEPRARPLGFSSISVAVHIDADAPEEVLRALVDHAVLWSPVANTLHDPVDLIVSVVEP